MELEKKFICYLLAIISMKERMVFTIEPIICLNRNYSVHLLNDKWSVLNPSAQFEHTILITKQGYEILTKRNNEAILILTKIVKI